MKNKQHNELKLNKATRSSPTSQLYERILRLQFLRISYEGEPNYAIAVLVH